MEFTEIDILTLLPQQPPFVMVDKLLHYDEIVTATELAVREDNIFVENGKLSPSGLIENIAQTCAARMGYINNVLKSESVKIGVIGAIKNLKIIEKPSVGDIIETTIEVVDEVFQMTLVNARIKLDNRIIVSAEMKIALTDIDSKVD